MKKEKSKKLDLKNPLYLSIAVAIILVCVGANYLVNASFNSLLKKQFRQDMTKAQAECMIKVVSSEVGFLGKLKLFTGISKTLAEEMKDLPVGKIMGCAFIVSVQKIN